MGGGLDGVGLVLIVSRMGHGRLAEAEQQHDQRRNEQAQRGPRQEMGSGCRHSSISATDDEAPTACAAPMRR